MEGNRSGHVELMKPRLPSAMASFLNDSSAHQHSLSGTIFTVHCVPGLRRCTAVSQGSLHTPPTAITPPLPQPLLVRFESLITSERLVLLVTLGHVQGRKTDTSMSFSRMELEFHLCQMAAIRGVCVVQLRGRTARCGPCWCRAVIRPCPEQNLPRPPEPLGRCLSAGTTVR